MGLDELLVMMERRNADTSDASGNVTGVSARAASTLGCTRDTPDTSEKLEVINCSGPATAVTSRWWRFHYSSREPKEASFVPPANQAEASAGEPDAIMAEPCEPVHREPNSPLAKREEVWILAWLTQIGETDEEIITEVLDQSRADANARQYFLNEALKDLRSPDEPKYCHLAKKPSIVATEMRGK